MHHLTVDGSIRIARRVYWSPESGTERPLDGWLGIDDASVSRGARELCSLAAMAAGSFAKGTEVLWRLGQLRVSDEQLRTIAEAEGRRVKDDLEEGRVGPDWTAADCRTPGGVTRIVLGVEGVMVPVITAAEKMRRRGHKRRRTKAKRRPLRERLFKGSEHPWKEFKIAGFYDPSKERVWAFGTAGGPDVIGRRMRRAAGRLRIGEATERVAVTDGAEWIRGQLATRLPMVDVRILDYFHLMEHVGEAAVIGFGAGCPETMAWIEAASKAALEEGVAGLLVKIRETLRSVRSSMKREAFKKLEQYVANHAEMLDYPTYRARGFDIGSGPTESLCRTLTARLKGGGKRWNTPNAETLMALAALKHSRLWENYWAAQARKGPVDLVASGAKHKDLHQFRERKSLFFIVRPTKSTGRKAG